MGDLIRRKKLDSILRWLRSCACCQSFLPPIDLVCKECEARVSLNRDRVLRSGYPFPVYSLFEWSEESAALIKPLIYGMKGGYAYRSAHLLTSELIFKLSATRQGIHTPRFVYPGSSSHRKRHDHAWLLAHLLAEQWRVEAPLRLEFESKAEGNQKLRSQEERSKRRFQLPEGLSPLRTNERWVFVDDVITSGSTAMAAFMALGDPEEFEVWALACRPKLAGISGI
jgi:predicted amidophosphoribosyltransferase